MKKSFCYSCSMNQRSGLCRSVNSPTGAPWRQENHICPFVTCRMGMIYKTPLLCGRCHIGQTGRCMNDRLREHVCAVRSSLSGHLAVPCKHCLCEPFFEWTVILGVVRKALIKEVIEVKVSHRLRWQARWLLFYIWCCRGRGRGFLWITNDKANVGCDYVPVSSVLLPHPSFVQPDGAK